MIRITISVLVATLLVGGCKIEGNADKFALDPDKFVPPSAAEKKALESESVDSVTAKEIFGVEPFPGAKSKAPAEKYVVGNIIALRGEYFVSAPYQKVLEYYKLALKSAEVVASGEITNINGKNLRGEEVVITLIRQPDDKKTNISISKRISGKSLEGK